MFLKHSDFLLIVYVLFITGEYCPGVGRELPAGNCTQGYYCPGAQNTSTPIPYACPIGHFCPWGSGEPIRCENGTYQDETTQYECKACPAGYFCDNTMDIVVLDNTTTVCPMGYFCPEGTRYANEFACPIGTFNNLTGIQELADCTPCLGGYECPLPGRIHYRLLNWFDIVCVCVRYKSNI